MKTRWMHNIVTFLFSLAVALLVAVWSPADALADAEAVDAPTASSVVHPVIPGLDTRHVGGMRFHFPADHAAVANELISAAPIMRDRILADLSPHALDNVDIYMIDTIEDYFLAQGIKPRSPHWASGLALLGHDVILVRMEAQGMARLELDRTLAHELSHIALHHHVNGERLPVWFVEGFALLQTEDWNISRQGPLAEAALVGGLIPLYELNHKFPQSAGLAPLAYAESGHFVHWLIHDKGRDRFRELTHRLGEGQKWERAFEETYGRGFLSLEREWRNGLTVDGGWIAIFVASSSLFFAMSLLFIGLYFRVRQRRKKAWARMPRETSAGGLPRHLEDFGPFAGPMMARKERGSRPYARPL